MTRMRDKKAFPPSRVASCVWSTDAVRVCTRWCVRLVTGDRTEAGGECVLVYVCIRTDLILTISAHWPLSGRQIFEDFRALRAQANFDSNFGKSLSGPNRRAISVTSDVLFDARDASFGHTLRTRLGHDEQRLGRPRQGRDCRFG